MFQPFLHPFLANVDDLRLAALFASIRSPFVDVHHPPARQPPATGPENSISGYRQSPSTLSPPPPFRATVKASKLHSNARLLVTANGDIRVNQLRGPRVCVFTHTIYAYEKWTIGFSGFVPEGGEILFAVKCRVYDRLWSANVFDTRWKFRRWLKFDWVFRENHV